jgi:PEP-CTERM motif
MWINSWRGAVVLSPLAFLAFSPLAVAPARAGSITLGAAGNFAMFADVTGSTGTTNINLNNFIVNGNLGAPTITGAAPNHYNGNVYTTGGSQPAGTFGTGCTYNNSSSALISQAQQDAITASNQLAALTATQTLSGISSNVTIAGNGGVNVIDVNGSITSGFKVSGGANDIFVFNVTGTLNFNSGIAADITGTGVTASNIIYNFIGTTAGQTVNTMVPDTINGTLLSVNGNYKYTLDSLANGAAIDLYNGATAITGMSGQTQNGTGNFFNGVPSSIPEPSTLLLASLGALGVIGGYGLHRRRSA